MSTKKVGPEVGAFVPIEVNVTTNKGFTPIEIPSTPEATPVTETEEN